MTSHHTELMEERKFRVPLQEVTLDDFASDGLILDIGGGGAGIIGLLKGEQVVAIDPSAEELIEAPAGPLKIVMDARELRFLDESFGAATAFFTFMYIPRADHERVFREVWRTLKAGGKFLIWDANIPPRSDPTRDIFAVPILVRLPGGEVRTGYGRFWGDEELSPAHYVAVAQAVGFEVVGRRETGHTFFLELRKP